MSAINCANEASMAKQANEWEVREIELMDEQVVQYLCPDLVVLNHSVAA